MNPSEIVYKLPKEKLLELQDRLVEIGLADESGERHFQRILKKHIRESHGGIKRILTILRSATPEQKQHIFTTLVSHL